MHDLHGKVVLITGASSGIGCAAAKLLGSRGAQVAIHYHSNRQGAEEAAEQIRAEGGDCALFSADVSDRDQVNRMASEVLERFGAIHVLVNNAGAGIQPSRFMELQEELWDKTYAVNVKSVLFCSQAVLRDMLPRGEGKIINISSGAARFGGAGESVHYASAKGAVNTLTIGMAREFADQGILVNAVAPGVIDTAWHEKFSSGERLQQFLPTVPLKRAGSPQDVAEMIAFLASDSANYITGEIFNVSGGR